MEILRHSIAGLLALALLGACAPMSRQQAPPATPINTATVSILGTNDIHGALLGTEHMGGMELLAGYVNNLRLLRAKDGGAVLLIDAGDMWQGTLESNLVEGASVVAAFNELGYTAAAFGNHEFDYGPVGKNATALSAEEDPQGAMKARASEAAFPMLAANLIDAGTGKPVAWHNVQPSVIVEAASVRVGIIGVMTEGAFEGTILANSRGLQLAPIAETVQKHAELLRADGATIIVLTAHAGAGCDEFGDPNDLSSCAAQGEIIRVANALPPETVDVIIGGHVHEGMAHVVNGIAIVSAYSSNRAFDRIDLEVDTDRGTIVSRQIFPPQALCRYLTIAVLTCAKPERPDLPLAAASYAGKPVLPNAGMAEIIAPAVALAGEVKDQEVGIYLETRFRRTEIPESAIGNLFVDALLESSDDADFVIHNARGGIRADLPSGELLYGHLYEMFPFDNRMTAVELSGSELRHVLRTQLESGNWRANFSGGTVTARCESGELQVAIERQSGEEVRDEERVKIVTADFLLSGGDDIFRDVIPPGGYPIEGDAPLIRDVLENWFRERGGSISAEMFFDENERHFVYDSAPPIDCGSSQR